MQQLIEIWAVDYYNRACDLHAVAVRQGNFILAKKILTTAESVMKWRGFMSSQGE